MSANANKAIALRFLDLVSAHDLDGLSRMIAPAWTMQGGPPGLPPGPEGLRQLFATFGRVEQRWSIEHVLAEGDLVAVRAVNTCAQDSFLGVPSHGRVQVFTATFVHRIVAGVIEATWRNADDLGRLLQLGGRVVAGEMPR
jgi:predicted SnoaL-like aldol condensation-catalyzing enzyme